MSRLTGRIRHLDDRLGGCPTCAHRGVVTVTECVGDDGCTRVRAHGDPTPCPDCGQPPETVTIRFTFNPYPDGDRDPRSPCPGSLQWQRQQPRQPTGEG